MKKSLRLTLLLSPSFLLQGCTACFCDYYMFSAVNGVITLSGKPMAHVEVEQSFFSPLHGRRGKEVVATDAQGRFFFTAVTQYVTVERLHQTEIDQVIKIRHDGSEYVAWNHKKNNYDKDGELGGPISLDCDLSLPDTDKAVRGDNRVSGICNFN
ncbi:MAG: hypothetical protein OEZ68_03065 [Gammaproteobacteria bacterium]|nr:hypothetical protein [Gammaproteobacteria bacterium]MDH5799763.1 hypothetical protein [Gammaproteobacteria bacterium]